MGTLTSSSFSAVNLSLQWSPISSTSRKRIELFVRKSNCFLCKEVSKRYRVLNRNFARSWCFGANNNGDNDGDSSNNASNDSNLATTTSRDEGEEKAQSNDDFDSNKSKASMSSRPPTISTVGPSYNNFQVDSFKLMELFGPEKVDPADVKLIKKKLFGYSTFWVTKEEPFGDLGEGILFLGNLRGKREEVFSKLQNQLAELMGDKYNLFMVEEPNYEGTDPRGGPRVSFGMLRKEVSEQGPTTLWQYVIALLLFVLTIGSSVELGIASQEVGHFLAAFPKKVKLSIPFFIPNITLGSFGAITQTKVDISLAGPFAGATLSFSMFAVFLLLSSNPNAAGDLVWVPSMLFQGSLLLGLISRATLGYSHAYSHSLVHPLVIAGYPCCRCGLTTSAFNVLPMGCLDGGRAIQGALGKNALIGFGLTTYTLLGLGVLSGPLSLPWGPYVLICQVCNQ
ncbi:hypothetical protein LOK49_LG12G02138 [Camellia lanceoleosa]|uniref:Uncharacterized protein n=1 Tax=Camellia lanceoleosa TaxID=1840588 RepID=A0ACC0FNC0_9ERIC|nr:hypothetical protein LOK49_LG12G02138 [Camellia lanceoleosa]